MLDFDLYPIFIPDADPDSKLSDVDLPEIARCL